MADVNSIIEGIVKFRDGKKWKSRWCVMRKLSPVADCLHLQLYRDFKERCKQAPTKASLSLQHFLGIDSGFTIDKESNTIAIICQDLIVVLAFDTRENLIQWQVKITKHLGDDIKFVILVSSAPPKTKIPNGPAKLHVHDNWFCLTTGCPPKLIGLWNISHLRRYGIVDGRFCFEAGSRCGKWEGFYLFITDQCDEIILTFDLVTNGEQSTKRQSSITKAIGNKTNSTKTTSHSSSSEMSQQQREFNHSFDGLSNQDICSSSLQELDEVSSCCNCDDSLSDSRATDFLDTTNLYRSSTGNSNGCTNCPNCSAKIEPNYCNSFDAVNLSKNCQSINKSGQIKHQGLDIVSVCSSYDSNSSDYSVPRCLNLNNKMENFDSKYDAYAQVNKSQNSFSPCQCCLLKSQAIKSIMYLNTINTNNDYVGQYKNYDLPKNPIHVESDYDTPVNIQDQFKTNSNEIEKCEKYENYDMPSYINHKLKCVSEKQLNKMPESSVTLRNGDNLLKINNETSIHKLKPKPKLCNISKTNELYENIEPNYTNLKFELSLPIYENSKEFQKRNKTLIEDIKSTKSNEIRPIEYCCKCGHTAIVDQLNLVDHKQSDSIEKQPNLKSKKWSSPLHQQKKFTTFTSKSTLFNGSVRKALSNPNLNEFTENFNENWYKENNIAYYVLLHQLIKSKQIIRNGFSKSHSYPNDISKIKESNHLLNGSRRVEQSKLGMP